MHARALSFHPAPLALAMAILSAPASAQLLPADRMTTWNPGVVGGIPVRTTICATVNASTYGNGASEASAGIQAAINNCPAGQVVQLSAGTFRMNNNVVINKGITLRGAGPNLTTLQKTNGATPGNDTAPEYEPIVIIGPHRYPKPDESSDVNLTADAVKGAFSVTVTSGAGFAAGQFVILDEDNYNTGAFVPLPDRNNQPTSVRIWATDRVVWQRHSPSAPEDDPFPDALSWFSRTARPVNELKEITAVNGNTITFNTPIHISYRTSHTAQLTRYAPADRQVKFAGLEDVKLTGGSDGQVRFESAAYSWVRNIENTVWLGEGVAVNHSFRCELRDSFIHDGAWPAPGGGGYAISIADESSEILVENNIIMKANKMMVARSAGTASVIGYNYAQDGFINYALDWQEVGINGSHMVGPHHMLFEGNESFNYDSDNTHGSAIYHTVFRNHLTGRRLTFSGLGNARTMGLLYGSYWHSFVGNVLGNQGQTSGWIYNDPGNAGADPWSSQAAIYRLGYDPIHWEQKVDTKVVQTTIRDGNFNYLTNQVNWDNTPQTLPNSLYLAQKPAFFGTWTWPWVDPIGATKLYVLPAKARYEGISAPPPQASIADVAIVEGTGTNTVAQFPVTLSGATGQTVTISYTTTALTAAAGADFVATSGVVTFPPGQTVRQVPVTVIGDGVDEVDETFRVDLSAPQQAVLADAQATAVIDDDDGPTISAPTLVTTEGNSGTTPATFVFTLSAPSPQSVVLSYATSDGTATAGSDYVATSGTVTFAPGTTSVPVSVQISGDTLDEPNEAFDLDLSGAVDGRLAAESVIGRIMDDDGDEIALAELQHGMTLHRDLQSVGGLAGRDLFILRQPARSSWEVVVDQASGDLGAGQGPRVERVANDLTSVLQSSLRVGAGPARTLSWQNSGSTTAIGYVRVESASCTSNCGPDDSYRIRVYETTGRIARFNMFNGQSTVVILQNTTSRSITGMVNFWSPAGVRLAGQTFTLAPRASTTIFGINIPAIANQSGAVTVTHDGPYAAVVGKSVTLDAVAGFSFDSPLLPVSP